MNEAPESFDKAKFVISDCHLSAGRLFEGRLNPHEDFHFDEEMCDLLDHFSSGRYGTGKNGPVEVELIIAGDFLDYLNVPYHGEFEDLITEDIALYKTKAIIKGHPQVMIALRRFASLPGKTITYLIGNHDAELFFPSVIEEITRCWDPEGRYPSPKVKLINDKDRIVFDEIGVEIRHGQQLEPGNELTFSKPFLPSRDPQKKTLNIPWGSVYVLKVLNRLKWEREYFDKVRPIKVFVLFGLILDPWFTIRFIFLSGFYFFKTRIFATHGRGERLREILKVIRQESRFFHDYEKEAREILTESKEVKTIIMGHTHRPMNKVYSDGKQYINTGTWVKMIDLDWRGLGQQVRRTFALIHIRGEKAHCELRQWVGEHSPHKLFNL